MHRTDKGLADASTAFPGYISVDNAAHLLGVTYKRLKGALTRAQTSLKALPPARPVYTRVTRGADPLPPGHPISRSALVGDGIPYSGGGGHAG